MGTMRLRLWSMADGQLIQKWMSDPAYFSFFRGNSLIPTAEDCANYPAWSGNMVMMLEGLHGDGFVTYGMAIGYHANWRNGTIKAGILLDKSIQGSGFGYDAISFWTKFLFGRGFRKVT